MMNAITFQSFLPELQAQNNHWYQMTYPRVLQADGTTC